VANDFLKARIIIFQLSLRTNACDSSQKDVSLVDLHIRLTLQDKIRRTVDFKVAFSSSRYIRSVAKPGGARAEREDT